VTRELAVPTAGCDRAALSDHLAGCPACSSFAADADAFDRLWDVTRPLEPSARAWESVWSGVADRLDRPESLVEPEPAVLPIAAAAVGGIDAWPRRGLWLFSMAQAAALLLAFSLLMTRASRPTGDVPSPAPAQVAVNVEVDIDPGQVVLIHGDGRVVDRTAVVLKSGPNANALDDTFAMFNAVEAMAD